MLGSFLACPISLQQTPQKNKSNEEWQNEIPLNFNMLLWLIFHLFYLQTMEGEYSSEESLLRINLPLKLTYRSIITLHIASSALYYIK